MTETLKLPEVARRLGVSEKTARRYVKAGDLPSVFVGNAYRVSEEDVERYLRQARVPAGGEPPKKAQAPPPPEDEERGLTREWALAVMADDLAERVDALVEEMASSSETHSGDVVKLGRLEHALRIEHGAAPPEVRGAPEVQDAMRKVAEAFRRLQPLIRQATHAPLAPDQWEDRDRFARRRTAKRRVKRIGADEAEADAAAERT